jgi:leucyl aminopeptidase (aminopeptidase T)
MALFMDVHEELPEGATAADVASAHEEDLKIQDQYGVNYKSYWVDETNGKAWCLVEAPSADAAEKVHKEAHGLLADRIYPVTEGR